MTELAILSLVLAAASDVERGEEEAWADRFEEADRLRKKYGIPSLTPKERMTILLGQPFFTGYAVQSTGYCKNSDRPDIRETGILFTIYKPSLGLLGGFHLDPEKCCWKWDLVLKNRIPYNREVSFTEAKAFGREEAQRLFVTHAPGLLFEGLWLTRESALCVLGPTSLGQIR
jgi:hypothetical protein